MKRLFLLFIFTLFLAGIEAQTEYNYFTDRNDRIYYEIQGSGKPVLFLSGGPGGSPESLSPIVEYVSLTNKSVLLHQRGTGLSSANHIDSATITLDRYIDDINTVLAQEKIDKFYVIGHSWGAMLALEYMTRYPDRVSGAILLGSSGYGLDFVKDMNNEIFSRMNTAEMDSLKIYFNVLSSGKKSQETEDTQNKLSALLLSKQFYNPSLVNELLALGPMNMNVNHFMMNDLLRNAWNLQSALEGLSNPVLIINGDHDPIQKKYVEELKSSIKHCELHFLDQCGHYIWLEKPEETKNLIQDFLKRN